MVQKALLLLFLGRGGGGLSGLGLRHALLELVHAPSRIHKLLLPRIERMANVADADNNNRFRGTGFHHVATRATDFRFLIFRMNS